MGAALAIDRRTRVVLVATVVAVAATLTGIGLVAGQSECSSGCAEGTPEAVAPADTGPATVTVTPADNATGVDPLGAVSVKAAGGALTEVRMVNGEGKAVPGVMTPDRVAWKPTVKLGYGRTYTMSVRSRGTSGTPARQQTRFSTLTPGNQAAVALTTTSGAALQDGGTYGIGTVVVAHFDEPIVDREAAERRLRVTSTPAVHGSWYWVDDQNAHWRPQNYYQPGTRVTVAADIYGASLGGDLYGQADKQVSFVIGDSHISVADGQTKQVKVYDDGKLVRTMPTSMGMGGTETVDGRTLSFWTQPGVYTVMDKANPVVMDSSTYGLPINSRLGYKETIYYATRISTDGIYLHQLQSTVWAQGNTNVSHGCLNLNSDNAQWFYHFSRPGDVVEVRNTGGKPVQIWQNGDWSVPWDQWLAGSALA